MIEFAGWVLWAVWVNKTLLGAFLIGLLVGRLRYHANLSNARLRMQRAEKSYDESRRVIDRLEGQSQNLTSRVLELEEQHRTLNQQNQNLERMNQDLSRVHAELHHENARLRGEQR